jgi:hypothetical protein
MGGGSVPIVDKKENGPAGLCSLHPCSFTGGNLPLLASAAKAVPWAGNIRDAAEGAQRQDKMTQYRSTGPRLLKGRRVEC